MSCICSYNPCKLTNKYINHTVDVPEVFKLCVFNLTLKSLSFSYRSETFELLYWCQYIVYLDKAFIYLSNFLLRIYIVRVHILLNAVNYVFIHTGERPRICDICGYCFGNSSEPKDYIFNCHITFFLPNRFLYHTGEDQDGCPICVYKYKTIGIVILNHTGENIGMNINKYYVFNNVSMHKLYKHLELGILCVYIFSNAGSQMVQHTGYKSEIGSLFYKKDFNSNRLILYETCLGKIKNQIDSLIFNDRLIISWNNGYLFWIFDICFLSYFYFSNCFYYLRTAFFTKFWLMGAMSGYKMVFFSNQDRP